MIDFGLTDGYRVHDGLDQEEVFSPLLWCIFYDPLLCKVKHQKSVCGYRLISHFVSKSGRVESQAGLSSYFATGAFVDDTIWIGSSQSTTQHILDIASKFFRINDISINNDKTVAIPINCKVENPAFFISGLPISVAKKGESHWYLGIFLSTEDLSKLSLAKAYSDICFFTNLVLKKAISNKQFLYLVLAVLQPIISYRTQFSFVLIGICNKWDAMICKSLKLKSGLPLDFLSDSIHHPSFYGLRSFLQIQSEGKVASLINFANSGGIVGHLFSYKSHDLQKLDPCGPIPEWFRLYVVFLAGENFSPAHIPLLANIGPLNILGSSGFVSVCDCLSQVNAKVLSVYTDGSLRNLGTVGCEAGAVAFFEDIGMGLGVGVSGLMLSIMAELQAIALALKCVPVFSNVHLFSDSQSALDVCKSELGLVVSDFCNRCWGLKVNWHKVKGHSGISGNERANVIAGAVSVSDWFLPPRLDEHFLMADGNIVSDNSRHFVCDTFRAMCHVRWEVGSGSKFLPVDLCADVNWSHSSLIKILANACSYFMKALHHQLPVTVDDSARRWLLNSHMNTWKTLSGSSVSSLGLQYPWPSIRVLFLMNDLVKLSPSSIIPRWHAKHCAYMEKHGLIPLDGLFPTSVSGLTSRLSAGVVDLLGIDKAFGVHFGFCKSCMFFSSIGDSASVYIAA
ncbi:hypothetical protein G9A89_010981 [Geosiphon pyriformis]|nr:hypothetical protein G9A89_010981 [Geosiphon pyriformis]